MGVTLQQATAPAGGGSGFGSGTKMLFVQTSAPTGWTKDTDQNDKALRIVSGTPSTGGSSAFSTVFGKTATDAHTLTSSEMPSHSHVEYANVFGGGARVSVTKLTQSTAPDTASVTSTGTAGSGGSHTHNMDIRVQYVDVIKATKD